MRSAVRLARWSLVLLLSIGAAPSFADFRDGLEAFDAGDFAAAVAAWRPLAEAGDRDAQLSLAGLYLEGLGVRRDPAEAVRLYRLAAEQGDAVAQLNLGDLYARGLGVERDLGLATCWLTLSARQGRQWPRARIQEIEPLMTAAEQAEAKRCLRDVPGQ